MLVGMLALIMAAQTTTVGPALSPAPHTTAVPRTGDATVLGAVGATDANDIEITKLAVTKASSGDVKSYATTLLHEHQQSLTTGTNLAKRLRITRLLPADSAMARAQVQEMVALNNVSGAAFDKAFMQFIVDDHKAAIVQVNGTLMPLATSADVKAFLRQSLPVLRRHEQLGEAWLAAHP
jgi:putative membrane protein